MYTVYNRTAFLCSRTRNFSVSPHVPGISKDSLLWSFSEVKWIVSELETVLVMKEQNVVHPVTEFNVTHVI